MFRIVRKELSDGPRFDAQGNNGDILGAAFVRLVSDEVILDSIQTNLGERKRGVGDALLTAVISWGKSQGAKKLTGEFAPDCTVNPAEIIEWYKKRGIEVNEEDSLIGYI